MHLFNLFNVFSFLLRIANNCSQEQNYHILVINISNNNYESHSFVVFNDTSFHRYILVLCSFVDVITVEHVLFEGKYQGIMFITA